MDKIDWSKFEVSIPGMKQLKVIKKHVEYFQAVCNLGTGKAEITYLAEPKQ